MLLGKCRSAGLVGPMDRQWQVQHWRHLLLAPVVETGSHRRGEKLDRPIKLRVSVSASESLWRGSSNMASIYVYLLTNVGYGLWSWSPSRLSTSGFGNTTCPVPRILTIETT